jgi:hypothetical protein
VYPASSPKHPPPVESPALVPDFAAAWTTAYQKAKAKIAAWSLEEKVNVTTGVGWMYGRCVGNIPPISNFLGLCLDDSPLGVRHADFVTGFPAAFNAASTAMQGGWEAHRNRTVRKRKEGVLEDSG